MSLSELCARDLSVLDLIFDHTKGENEPKDLTLPINDEIDCKDQDEGSSERILRSKEFEIEGVRLSESGKLEEALGFFNQAIDKAPRRPSPYNNRAQLYRLMDKDSCKSK